MVYYVELFQDARHPASNTFQSEAQWSVYGLSMAVDSTSVNGYIDQGPFIIHISITNSGEELLTGIIMKARYYLPLQSLLHHK